MTISLFLMILIKAIFKYIYRYFEGNNKINASVLPNTYDLYEKHKTMKQRNKLAFQFLNKSINKEL